jgi:hypothetical protein
LRSQGVQKRLELLRMLVIGRVFCFSPGIGGRGGQPQRII